MSLLSEEFECRQESETMSSMRVDAVIVTYNSAASLGRSIASCRRCPDIESITVVDNASTDRSVSAARLAGADVVKVNGNNEGFARAVNYGVATGAADLVLLLNPDAEMNNEALGCLISALVDDASAVMAGPVLLSPPGTFKGVARQKAMQLGARRFSTVVNRLVWWLPLSVGLRPAWGTPEYRQGPAMAARTDSVQVDYLSGTALLLRRSFLAEIGGLDERFFMYSEDEDLGRVARARGRRALLVPQARVMHVGGASTVDRAWARARIQAANRLLLEKWRGRTGAAFFWAMIGPVLASRAVVLRVVGRATEACEVSRQRRLLRAARAELDAVAEHRQESSYASEAGDES